MEPLRHAAMTVGKRFGRRDGGFNFGEVGEVRIELEERFEQVWGPGTAFRDTLGRSGRFV